MPRPIVTYNPECLSDDWEDKNLKGEVFRTRFKHTHLPPVTTYLMVQEAIQASHNAKDAKIFYAGAFADGGARSGLWARRPLPAPLAVGWCPRRGAAHGSAVFKWSMA